MTQGKGAKINSRITCPFCGFEKAESMPEDYCQITYQCSRCSQNMHPKKGSCCVFCSYGDTPCSSKQV